MKKVIEYSLFLVLLAIFAYLAWGKLGAFFCNQGNYYFEHQDYKKAVVSYKNSIRIDPKAWMAHLELAGVYMESKDYQASAQEYKKTLSINPLSARAYDSLARIYYEEGIYAKALGTLLQGQKESPADERIKESFKSCCSTYFADALKKSTGLYLGRKNKEAISMLENVLLFCPGNALAVLYPGLLLSLWAGLQ